MTLEKKPGKLRETPEKTGINLLPMRTSLVLLALAAMAASPAALADAADCSASAFQQNSCSACQTQSLPSGEGDKTISDVAFTWKNTGTTQQVAYDNEQPLPQLVLVGTGASYASEPADAAAFWKWSPSLAWVAYDKEKEFLLDAGKQVDTYMSASGAAYVLKTGSVPAGEPVALVKSTIAYHDINADFEDGPKKEYTACTLYVNGTGATAAPAVATGATAEPAKAEPVAEPAKAEPVVAVPAPVATPAVSSEAKAKITSHMTKVATGPAENLVVVLALAAAALVMVLRRKSRA